MRNKPKVDARRRLEFFVRGRAQRVPLDTCDGWRSPRCLHDHVCSPWRPRAGTRPGSPSASSPGCYASRFTTPSPRFRAPSRYCSLAGAGGCVVPRPVPLRCGPRRPLGGHPLRPPFRYAPGPRQSPWPSPCCRTPSTLRCRCWASGIPRWRPFFVCLARSHPPRCYGLFRFASRRHLRAAALRRFGHLRAPRSAARYSHPRPRWGA